METRPVFVCATREAVLAEVREAFGACEFGEIEGTVVNAQGEEVAEFGEIPEEAR
jgi:hypothetical protein